MKEIKDLNKWRNVLCSWIGRLNIVKMSFLRKLLSRFAPVPVKTPGRFAVDYRKLIVIWKDKSIGNFEKTIMK